MFNGPQISVYSFLQQLPELMAAGSVVEEAGESLQFIPVVMLLGPSSWGPGHLFGQLVPGLN